MCVCAQVKTSLKKKSSYNDGSYAKKETSTKKHCFPRNGPENMYFEKYIIHYLVYIIIYGAPYI